MLKINNIDTFYGDVQILKGVTLDVGNGDLVAVIGANGAGKTTLIKTISGLLRPKNGEITFDGNDITKMEPHKIVSQGLVQVPEGRMLFPKMSVRENLEMGGFKLSDKETLQNKLDAVFEFLPVLKDRAKQIAQTMSGGEQQMLAIGRALMSDPRLILFDEPSLGLAPKLVVSVLDMVVQINKEMGVSVLLVEQNVQNSCRISDRAYVLENGEIVLKGTGEEMLDNEHVRRAYLGI